MSQYRHVVEYVHHVQTLDSVSNCCGLLVGKCFFNILRSFFPSTEKLVNLWGLVSVILVFFCFKMNLIQ